MKKTHGEYVSVSQVLRIAKPLRRQCIMHYCYYYSSYLINSSDRHNFFLFTSIALFLLCSCSEAAFLAQLMYYAMVSCEPLSTILNRRHMHTYGLNSTISPTFLGGFFHLFIKQSYGIQTNNIALQTETKIQFPFDLCYLNIVFTFADISIGAKLN